MTSPRRFEHDVPALLADLYLAGIPDYRDDLVQQVARVRQRPAWTFPGRWLPMELVTTRVPTTRLPMRQLGVLALIAILIASALAAYIGSRPKLPSPFGPAGNGQIVFVDHGDIYVSDTITGEPRPLVSNPAADTAVRVSPDGRQISFLRAHGAGAFDLYVGSITGADVRRLNEDPLLEVGRAAWSPDGSTIALDHSVHGVPVITLYSTDGSGGDQIDTGGIHAWDPDWRPPDGGELLFRGERNGEVDVYVVQRDGSDLRPLGIPHHTTSAGESLVLPTWSPDGTRVAFHSSDIIQDGSTAATGSWQSHVFDTRTSVDIVLSDGSRREQHDTEPIWSPDGTRVLTQRFIFGQAAWMAVLPADGGARGVDMDRRSEEYPPSGWRGQFSPDGSLVIAYYDFTDEAVIFDPETGRSTDIDWSISEAPTYQRIAF